MLAREAGLEVPVETPRERERAEHAASLHDVCEAACQWFERQPRRAALTGRATICARAG